MGHHDAAAQRKEYWKIFVVLFILTAVEVGWAEAPLGKGLMISGLFIMAIAKAGLVGAYYMHLKHDTKFLQWTIIIPMAIPFFYAFVLVAEGWWRMLR